MFCPRAYKGRGREVYATLQFSSFFLGYKTSAPDVFRSYSFIPAAHFDERSVINSCYGYEIWRHK